MTQFIKLTGIRQAFATFSSSKTAMAVAAMCCVIGIVLLVVAVSSGIVSLDGLRKGVASVGSHETVVSHKKSTSDNADPTSESKLPDEVQRSKGAIVDSAPTFDIVRVEPDGNAVLAGLSAPGDKIEIMSGNRVLAIADANSAGEWALVLDEPLQSGGHQIAVRSISNTMDAPAISVQTVTISVPERSEESAIVMLEVPGEPSTIWQSPAVTIEPKIQDSQDGIQAELQTDLSETVEESTIQTSTSMDRAEENNHNASKTTQPDNEMVLNEPMVTVKAIETEGGEKLYVSGASRPKASVRLYLQNKLVGETVASPVGQWQLKSIMPLPQGRMTVRAEEFRRSDGAVLARREVPFQRDPKIVGSLKVRIDPGKTIDETIADPTANGLDGAKVSGKMVSTDIVIVGRGDNLWTIARRLYGSGVRYTTLYSANDDQIRNPSNVFPDQELLVPNVDTLAN